MIQNSTSLVMILAGGEGSRLHPLTKERAKPAVPFGGRYRIIDFVISNFVNSGFRKIKILTQFKSESLNRHISSTWDFPRILGEFVDPVPAQMRHGSHWYKGTADAIYQNINIIEEEQADYVFVFSGDHIYKMDVNQMLSFHKKKKADVTVAAIPKPIEEASEFGVIEVDEEGRIVGFEEKPEHPKSIPGNPGYALVSMGNYIFNREKMVKELEEDAQNAESANDFGKSILPKMFKKDRLFVYDFSKNKVPGMSKGEKGYWMDVGSRDAYWQANMDLVSVAPVFNLYSEEWPIHTCPMNYPPAKFVFSDQKSRRIGMATDSLVSQGCIISGGHIDRAVLSPGVRINSFSHVSESVLMEGVTVGRRARIKRAIIDKNVSIPAGMEIGYDLEEDKKRFQVSANGIVLIAKDAILK